MNVADIEFVDASTSAVIRRLSVGPLHTNCWIVIDPTTRDAMVIDPGDEPERIVAAVSDLNVRHFALTHTHWDHVLAVPELHDAVGVGPQAHPYDAPVWPHEQTHLATYGHFDAGTATAELLGCGCSLRPATGAPLWDGTTLPLAHGQQLQCGAASVTVIATPGHTPGSVSFLHRNRVFTGDTLFPGGPGLTRWPLSDFETIISSIDTQLFTLPGHTIVHPGHGHDTTIGTEQPLLSAWISRGW